MTMTYTHVPLGALQRPNDTLNDLVDIPDPF